MNDAKKAMIKKYHDRLKLEQKFSNFIRNVKPIVVLKVDKNSSKEKSDDKE